MSAILSADDLNDFISPGVACIKPVETLPAPRPIDTSNPYEVTTEDTLPASDLPPAQISLTDCLACSGCVTSAEAVLVSLQSHSEVLHALDCAPAVNLSSSSPVPLSGSLEDDGRIFVASVSPQSRASIAATYGVSERVAGHMIEQLLSGPEGLRRGGKFGNGFEWVVDTNIAREACLVLGAKEVMASMNRRNKASEGGESVTTQPVRPILTSSCPGWICYAEKTHPHVLPHLSRLKSPQALTGTLLKTVLSRKLAISPDRIWHVAVMPCFDKKLEASREELTDFAWHGGTEGKRRVRDVDCVITSKELLLLADSRSINFSLLPRVQIPPTSVATFPDRVLGDFLLSKVGRHGKNSTPAAGTSGGNLYYILQYFSSQHPGSTIQTTRGRNADVIEYAVKGASGEPLFKAARCYGFRNIQNLVRRLKPSRGSRMPGARPAGAARRPGGDKATGSEYEYIEVMACPGGCTNGGGQIKVDDAVISGRPNGEVKPGPQEQKEWLGMVDEAYFSSDEASFFNGEATELSNRNDVVEGISPSYISGILGHWSSITGIDLDRLAYTSYRAVVSDVGKRVGETEQVVELAGKIGGGW
ncbi:MAG: Cytosolic Fe-S cluster assembly factor nar1 [Claussenomyces sp. TS43310]|nr:MAG: Cytosolic Fe-S cluster assembly factor nar1 [Claussenomyces sp. TS43310]